MKFEEKKGIHSFETFELFSDKVIKLKKEAVLLFEKLKKQGKTIAGYGASAKGNTLLNYFGLKNDTISFVVDKNPLKQGLYTPGTHIKVLPTPKLVEEKPDYVLLLAWNFKEEIIKQQKGYSALGGKFIVPIPWPKILQGNKK